MINAIVVLLGCQLAGEVLVRLLGLPVPGPVLGAAFLAAALLVRGGPGEALAGTATGLLKNLSLLFVPAAVGVVEHRELFADYGVALVSTVIVSTVLSLAVGALVFRAVARRVS
jgi:holin-like protein